MERIILKKFEMGLRVRDFSHAYPSADASYAAVLARFEERLAAMEQLAARQRSGLIATRAATARRKGLRRRLHYELIRHLVTVAEMAAHENPALAGRFRLPSSSMSNKAYLSAARAMLAEGEANRDLLTRFGLADQFLQDLATVVGHYDTAVVESNAGRRDHIGARSDLRRVADEIVELVALLDGLNRYRFGVRSAQLAEWTSARTVYGPATAPTGVATPAAAVMTTTGTGEVKPAA